MRRRSAEPKPLPWFYERTKKVAWSASTEHQNRIYTPEDGVPLFPTLTSWNHPHRRGHCKRLLKIRFLNWRCGPPQCFHAFFSHTDFLPGAFFPQSLIVFFSPSALQWDRRISDLLRLSRKFFSSFSFSHWEISISRKVIPRFLIELFLNSHKIVRKLPPWLERSPTDTYPSLSSNHTYTFCPLHFGITPSPTFSLCVPHGVTTPELFVYIGHD